MAASSRGRQLAAAVLRSPPSLCSRCAGDVFLPLRRCYSAAAEAVASIPSDDAESPPTTPQAHAPPSPYRIRAGIILTRAPVLTRQLTPFESAFYLYQKRLEERLATPFREATYFKEDTPSQLDWRLKRRERRGVAGRDIGRYAGRGRRAWDDEVRVGSDLADPARISERIAVDAVMRVSEDGEPLAPEERPLPELPLPRRTEADEKGDLRRLDRELDRTLYLVVRGAPNGGQWMFPSGVVPTSENLHETARRILAESAGVNMNTWIVGRVPVAHIVTHPVFNEADSSLQKRGEKTFFLKGRIMAGQAYLTGNTHGLTDFRWLTREELKEQLPEQYFHRVRNMMADR